MLVKFTLFALAGIAVRAATNPLQVVTIASPDGSAKANFIPLGATATNFWVKDKHGKLRDILLGYDDLTLYQSLADGHPYLGPIVGRYANRIKNGTFSIPITKNTPPTGPNVFHTPLNEHGIDTLHGGDIGYDLRNWTVAKRSASSVTFTLHDPAGEQGFPGNVDATVTYTLQPKATWQITMHATADAKTPIMLSGHHYWNLEAYQETQDLLGHMAQFPASRVIATDGILIPTGKLINVTGTPLDFRQAKSLGVSLEETAPFEFCGTGCTGFDNAWIYDNVPANKPKFSLWSVNSGIRMDVITDQPALQIYTCNGIFNPLVPIPRKANQGGPLAHYLDHSCLVVEQESWIDAINNPEFGINQIFGPGRDYSWSSTYIFSVAH